MSQLARHIQTVVLHNMTLSFARLAISTYCRYWKFKAYNMMTQLYALYILNRGIWCGNNNMVERVRLITTEYPYRTSRNII